LPIREIYLDLRYSTSEIQYAKNEICGHKESEEVNTWLSHVHQFEVFLLRSEENRTVDIDEIRLPLKRGDDKKRAFLTGAACHIVSNKSVEALNEMVKEKYKNDPSALDDIDVNEMVFRPTFVLDTDEAWLEEEYQQLRVQTIMWRQIGPCSRCKTTSLSLKNNGRSDKMEPYMTIMEKRKHPLRGSIFGVYYQPDLIPTRAEFE